MRYRLMFLTGGACVALAVYNLLHDMVWWQRP